MPYSEELKKQITNIENQISISKTQNLELENQLLKLKLAEFEEDMREEAHNNATLLKG
jgi:cell shape-determining protein MreC